MKTLSLNTFTRFEQGTSFSTKQQVDEFLKTLAEGLDWESEYFIAIYWVTPTWFRGYAIFTPEAGNPTRCKDIAKMADNQLAEGAIIAHWSGNPIDKTREVRTCSKMEKALKSFGLQCINYYTLRDGSLFNW